MSCQTKMARMWSGHLVLVGLTILCIGCSQPGRLYWVAFGGSQRDVGQDEHACRAAAAERVAPYAGDPLAFSWVPVEQTAYRDCMERKGYQLYIESKPLQRDGAMPVRKTEAGAYSDRRLELVADRGLNAREAKKRGCEAVSGEFGDTKGCMEFLNVQADYTVVLTPSAGRHAAASVNSRPTVLPIPIHR